MFERIKNLVERLRRKREISAEEFQKIYGAYAEIIRVSWEQMMRQLEEAELHLDETEENYIVYRYALLLFALNRAPNSDSHFAKPFKELIRCYLK